MRIQATDWTRAAALILSGILSLLMFCDKGNPVNANSDKLVFGTVTDIDGNVYKTIKIGNQEWMAENLRTTKYSDGSAIPVMADTVSPGYSYYDNTTNSDSINKFGALYNWYAVNTGKLAPVGWHVPDSSEWKDLEEYLIANGYNWNGTTVGNKIAKSLAANTDWIVYATPGTIGCDLTKNNRSGFSALPGGIYGYGGSNFIGDAGYWWSSTGGNGQGAYNRILSLAREDLNEFYLSKSYGLSVRLVKD
jgi:uncharacterized protein (TIGR02145 family)